MSAENFQNDMDAVTSGEEDNDEETGALRQASQALNNARAYQTESQQTTTLEEISAGLKKSQLCIGQLTAALQSVKLELLEARSNSKRKSASKSRSSSGQTGTTSESDVTRLGRKYGFMYYMWANKSIFTCMQRPTVSTSISDAYDTDAGWRSFIFGELYSFVPNHLHSEMEGLQSFQQDFVTGVEGIRSTLISRLKAHIPQFFNIPGFTKDSDPANCPEALNLFYVRNKITQYPPVLFEKAAVIMSKIFRNPLLQWIGRICLFGIASLSSSNMPADSKTKKTNGVLWEVTRTTTGMVATCAIFAIFLVSPDKQLSTKGDITKFQYATMWKHYREILDRNEGGLYDDLLDLFDDFIFKDAPQEDNQLPSGEMKIQSVKETMRQMRLGILNPDFLPENNSEMSESEHVSVGPAPSADEEAEMDPPAEISDHEDTPLSSSSSSTRARGRGRGRGRGRAVVPGPDVVAAPKPVRTTRKSSRNN